MWLGSSIASAQSDEKPGAKSFDVHCSACHQYDGQGMGEAPPLHGSPWVDGPEERLIKIVLHGVRGPMEIAGETYDREMPGVGKDLSDKALAELLTFVRTKFGKASPVDAAAVRRIRERHKDRREYWHVDELDGPDR